MAYSFRLLNLLMCEIKCLETLRLLETELGTATPAKKPSILERINVAVEEISRLNRLIGDHKAAQLQAVHS